MSKTYRDGDNTAYYSTDLVVALEHVDEVERTMRDLGVRFGGVQRSDLLGLALLPDIDDESAAQTVRGALRAELTSLGRPDPAGPWADDSAPSMDAFLSGLRQYFAARHAGWTPTLGKNRHVARVVGAGGTLDGKISHGGGSVPRAVAAPEWASEVRPADRGRGVRVGVLDTSISAQPWLAGGWVAPAADVLATDGPHEAAAGHATFVAGLVLRQAPGATVVARQVLSDAQGVADSWTVAQEIVRLGRTGVDVLNLSFLCHTEDGRPPMVLAAAIDRLGPDVLVVAAAGNHGNLDDGPDGRRKPAWPAALDHVVAVGSTDDQGTVSSFTPKDVPWIDVLVPGEDVVSTFLEGDVELHDGQGNATTHSFGGFASWSGTSFAAASLSGAVAARTEPGRVSAQRAWANLCPPTRPAPFIRLEG